ncbi:hypothetical protein ED733_004543 [Metarhizium rileyi]|uniref:Derlin n=1 Tax=Metarhizium rileyi (strain RCEF 4871) TaxID=1649241 RepID=A0A5C6G9Q3_METRR|nr:hypothetical protein ED733_004543 [Metarhizium rileyi]
MDVALENYWRLPPMSRNIATCAFVMSLGIVLGMLPSKYFIYHQFFILRFPPQIWRFATSFLITGSGLGLLFDTYFLYSYLSQMEVGNPRFPRKEDLIWYLIFVCGTILCYASTTITVPGNEEEYPYPSVQSIIRKSGLFCGVANHLVGFGFMMFLPALILALSYTVTQDQRGAKSYQGFFSSASHFGRGVSEEQPGLLVEHWAGAVAPTLQGGLCQTPGVREVQVSDSDKPLQFED